MNLSIKARFVWLGAGTLGIVVLLCLSSFYVNNEVSEARLAYQHSARETSRIVTLTGHLRSVQLASMEIRAAAQDGEKDFSTWKQEGLENLTALIADLTEARQAETNPEVRRLLEESGKGAEVIRKLFVNEMIVGAEGGKGRVALAEIDDALDAGAEELLNVMGKVSVRYQESMEIESEHLDVAVDRGMIAAVVGLLGSVVFVTFGLLQTARAILGPVDGIRTTMGRLLQGERNIAVPGAGRQDEIGAMAQAVQVFQEHMIHAEALEAEARATQARQLQRAAEREQLTAAFDHRVSQLLATVSETVAAVQRASGGLLNIAGETSERSTAMASAAEQIVASVEAVAASAEELGVSVQEISRRVQESTVITQEAVTSIDGTNVTVQGLAEAARRIGDIVSLISEIASQTNLLALNATIEAARAGEAGKGFAVVASEVKNLATQTARATEEITQQIAGIQNTTGDAVHAIQNIGITVGRANTVVIAIADSVSQQGQATTSIVHNVHEVAGGNREISAAITTVSRSAEETGSMAHQMVDAMRTLAAKADGLRGEVESFLMQMRAA